MNLFIMLSLISSTLSIYSMESDAIIAPQAHSASKWVQFYDDPEVNLKNKSKNWLLEESCTFLATMQEPDAEVPFTEQYNKAAVQEIHAQRPLITLHGEEIDSWKPAASAPHKVVVNKDQGPIKLWTVGDEKARVQLESVPYDKDHLTDTHIVLAHTIKSSLMSRWDTTKYHQYRLPKAWLSNERFSHWGKDQALFVYLLIKAQEGKSFMFEEAERAKEVIAALKNAPVIRTFEPEVTLAFTNYLTEKEIELSK